MLVQRSFPAREASGRRGSDERSRPNSGPLWRNRHVLLDFWDRACADERVQTAGPMSTRRGVPPRIAACLGLLSWVRLAVATPARLWWSISCACLVACGSGPVRPAQGVPKGDLSFFRERLSYELREVVEDNDLSSISIAVVDEHGLLFEEAFGFANAEDGVFATPHTPYRWGSNSKLFVMLALLQLEDAGKVSLDAPLTTYIPEFTIGPPPSDLPGAAQWKLSDITLRSMLTHHSGLPNDLVTTMFIKRAEPFESVIDKLAPMNAEFPVDYVQSYSNVAFALLGVVIERVSGESFDAYMQHHLFYPLAMRSASFVWNDYLEENVARSHDASGKVVPRRRLFTVPAGSLMASTHQMAGFATGVLRGGVGEGGRFISKAQLSRSMKAQNAGVALDFGQEQGLAWFVNPLARRWYGPSLAHGGGLPHHFSAFFLLPQSKLGVVAVTNCQRGHGVVQRLALRALELALEGKTGAPVEVDHSPNEVPFSDEPDDAELDSWAGHYATPFGDVTLLRSDDHLEAELAGRKMFVRPLADGTMGLSTEWLGLFEVRPDQLAAMRFALEQVEGQTIVVGVGADGRRRPFASKYEPVPAPPIWRKRVGTYVYQPGPNEDPVLRGLELYVGTSGALMARSLPTEVAPELPESFALRPVEDGSMVVEGLGRTHATRLTVDERGDLHVSGGRFSKRERRTARP